MNAFGYTGAYQLLDGTVRLAYRFLDTFTLNFSQPAPSRQEMNNSTYAECDPINNTDPTGLMSTSQLICSGVAIYAGMLGLGSMILAPPVGALVGVGAFFVATACGAYAML